MKNLKIFSSSDDFVKEFIRCTKTYSFLSIAVAWCGNPDKILPFKYLEEFRGKIKVILGISFYHTHPKAFTWFNKLKANIRIFNDNTSLFHPKIYLFSKGNQYAAFIGSSNLTSNGFYNNIEVNTLIEGNYSNKRNDEITKLKNMISKWSKNKWTNKFTNEWLKGYRKKYQEFSKKEKKHNIKSARRTEEDVGNASWLKYADWETFYKELLKEIREKDIDVQNYFKVLEATETYLKLPWKTSYFKKLEYRRIIEGLGEYAALGNISAAGQLRHLLAAGSQKELYTIVNAINIISKLKFPIHWTILKSELEKLCKLGLTMKVWGRFLCIIHPELYPTISSNSVRLTLAETLNVPKSHFKTPNGYIKLVRMIHLSPWFNSKKPKNIEEAIYWKYRVALIDLKFYEEE